MKTIKELFDLLLLKEEGLFGKVHIIELDTYYDFEDEDFYGHHYRVYHADGYCFEVSRTSSEEDDNIDGYEYKFFSDMFDGFKKIKDSEHAICLIKDYLTKK